MARTIDVAIGLDGKPHIWPTAAISFNPKTGEYKDYKGHLVKAVSDRMGVALDNIHPAKRRKPVGRDTSAEDTLIRRLLPKLKKMANSSSAEDGRKKNRNSTVKSMTKLPTAVTSKQ